MNVQQFNQLKKDVKGGNLKGLNKDVIEQLTLKQAQLLEDVIMDIELTDEGNQVLDILVMYIDSLVNEGKKVANTKAPKVKAKTEPAKEAPAKEDKAPKEGKEKQPFNKVNVGDTVHFRVEGEELEHEILIIYKGKNNIVGIMVADEREVFLIRKSDFNKQMFSWTDRHGEQYNIIVTI